MNFSTLLIQACTIQAKTLNQTGYEQIAAWSDVATAVPCRMDGSNSASLSDTEVRVNTDDNTFFFNPDTTIDRGNRIILDGNYYDVINVNKVLDSQTVHHLEVIGRLTDNK